MSLWAVDSSPVELRQDATEDDLQIVIRAVYRQVLGNEHLMESQRLDSAESLLRDGSITLRDFVRAVAKSEIYRSLFFESSSQYRFIELNFKHLLGRAPQAQSEISEHTRIYSEGGYGAEIDSYIDSDEYMLNFGDKIIPYFRSTSSQIGIKNVGFNRMFTLMRGMATNDSGTSSKLVTAIAANLPTAIKAPVRGSGAIGNTSKRFSIKASQAVAGPKNHMSNKEYIVDFNRMSQQVQNIHKMGGKIMSITEVG